jgi:hypothetical protein
MNVSARLREAFRFALAVEHLYTFSRAYEAYVFKQLITKRNGFVARILLTDAGSIQQKGESMFRPKLLVAALTFGVSVAASATTISFTDFASTAGLQLNGNAAVAVDDSSRSVLRVTPSAGSQSGSAFSTSAVTLGSNVSFSTKFRFNFNHPFNGGADGLVFVVQTVSNAAGGAGGGIGYAGLPNSVGIEFDDWNNGWGDGNSDNHVGIDINGNVNSAALNTSLPVVLDSAQDLFAWIDYNGATDSLEVRLSDVDSRPLASLLSYTVDLASVLGTPNAFVGFTSGTGAAGNNHDVISWEFRDTFAPVDVPVSVPEPASLLLLGAGVVGLGATRRRSKSGR